MSVITSSKSASANSRRNRIIKVAPMTRAVRLAMAASLAALALGASGGAFAAGCKAPMTVMAPCAPVAHDATPVLDLTLVREAAGPSGYGTIIMPLAISESDYGDVVIDNADPISEVNIYYSATAISGYSSGGSVDITNQATGALEAASLFGNATGINAYAYGNAGIDNAGEVLAVSVYENAIGLYGYSMTGDVSIGNGGDIAATSLYGLADGIFASGVNVDVSNSGVIEAESVYGGWAAGIEAQGTDLTTVTNDGSIYATAGYGQALGIYATGDIVVVTNNGDIDAQGYTATGIEAQGGSSVTVTNDGNIVAGSITTYYDPYTYTTSVYGSLLATGINATANYEDGAITITNNGDVSAVGYYGGTGIAATATGSNGSASVTNTGTVYASQYTKYGYGAYGIVASADGDASIDNASTGSIVVDSAGSASGATALSFAGNASVTNAGDITVTNDAILAFGAYGIVSFAQNGMAYAGNSGNVDVTTKYTGVGIDASGLAGATVDSSGDISVDAWRAYGIRADSGAGDVSVDNAGSIYATYSFSGGTAFGVLATSVQGDVTVDNSGDIYTTVTGQSVGIFGSSGYGDAGITNSGTISAYSYDSTAAGVFARADYGTASVDNSGTISTEAYYGDAFGVLARGGYVEVSNSGDISANGYYSATGIAASSYYGTTVSNTGGSIFAIAVGAATGINAQSALGDVNVANASDIEAVGIVLGATGINSYAYGNVDIDNSGDVYAGSLYGTAIGLYGYSIAGDVSIGNSGDITAISYYGLADGIFASGANVDVTNSGAIDTYGYTWTAGIEAQGADSTTITNSGDITATASGFLQVQVYDAYVGDYVVVASAPGGIAYGIYGTAGEGGLDIGNSGDITVDGGYVTGIEAQSAGDISITNSGDIVAGSGLNSYYNGTNYYTYYFGTQLATGINATSNGEAAAVAVTNSGDITAEGIFGATGIAATAGGLGGSVSVENSGVIYASANQKYGLGAYGIAVSADGDGAIDNSGDIGVYSAGAAGGATVLAFAGDASVTNSGDIEVTSTAQKYYGASGIVAFAQNGEAYASNSGSISAVSGNTARGIDASGFTGATVVNSGSVYANGKYAYGVYASSGAGDVSITNTDTGSIEAYSYAGSGFGVVGIASLGDVMVDNAGSIEVYAYGQAVGVFALAQAGDAMVDNSGEITVITGGNAAVGIFARADFGTATVDNSGDIVTSVEGVNGYIGDVAYGILARGGYVDVSNSGDISAFGLLYATGIVASSYYGTTVTSTGGSIYAAAPGGLVADAYGYYVMVGAATGIDAKSAYGDVTVSNASDITALSAYGSATGINAVALLDVDVTNSGDIAAGSLYGVVTGINAASSYIAGYGSFDGTTSVHNSGDIMLEAPYAGFGRAVGINATREYGDVVVGNSGAIDINAGGRSYGVYAHTKYGDVAVTNSGDISMLSHTDAQIGIQASTGSFFAGGGDVSVINSGNISVHSDYGFANGIGAVAGSVQDPYGNSYIRNSGDIDVFGQYFAAGIQTRASDGTATVVNSGDVEVATGAYFDYYDPGSAVGISVLSFFGGDLTIQNSGDVSVHGYTHAYGLYAKSNNDGNVSITNSGDVTVDSELTFARGVYAYSFYGNVTVNNAAAGSIDASGGFASAGIQAMSVFGDNVVNNAGTIHASGSDYAFAVAMYSYAGTSTLNNAATGTISAEGDDGYAWAVSGSDVVDTINNSGLIDGAVSLYGGDDRFNNNNHGVWNVDTQSTDFGDGNDGIVNNAGGLIRMTDGAIEMGSGSDTIVNNAGGLIAMTDSAIHMGAGPQNSFLNLGVITVSGDNLIDMGAGNTGAFTNVSSINFIDAHTDDSLTVAGNFGGTGALGLDVDLPTDSSDQVEVLGNMVAGAAQHVDILFVGLPATAHTSIDFAHVTGTSVAGSFVPGQILSYNYPRNFIDLRFSIGSRINAANTAADVFSIDLDVAGLLDSGTLAASAATGAANMLNDQIGTFRQRMGVNPYGDAGKVMSAFFRTYTSEGDVSPDHVAANFGQGGHFDYDQSTWGREIGVNANLFGNFHAGVVLGTADGRQRLTGAGVGENRMDGMTWGAYATWFAPQGYYIDLSGRWMAVDIRSTSAAGLMQSRAHTAAINLETGYKWTTGSGFDITPQLQYTQTKVEDVVAFDGDRADFEGHGGTSSRGRLGVEFSKSFQTTGGMTITPYGSINAIREFDGEMTYTVADNFYGATSTEGTSSMAELGLGIQKGSFAVSAGANWIDGGAFNSVMGAQLVVRFAW